MLTQYPSRAEFRAAASASCSNRTLLNFFRINSCLSERPPESTCRRIRVWLYRLNASIANWREEDNESPNGIAERVRRNPGCGNDTGRAETAGAGSQRPERSGGDGDDRSGQPGY